MLRKTPIWTWIIPSKERVYPDNWEEHGGKWLVYGGLDEIKDLASKIDGFVESGEIDSAKFWNASTSSAMCVYSLEGENHHSKEILKELGHFPAAWEYDYARKKNWTRPRFFLSAFYKLRILIKTFGIRGTAKFIFGAYR